MCARPNVSEQRIPQILEAALRIFGEQGLTEARMDDIAEAAGLSKATIYLYFDSKDVLIEKLLFSYLDQTLAALDQVAAEHNTTRSSLQAWVNRFTAELEENIGYTHLGLEFLSLAARKTELRNALTSYYTQYSELIAQILRDGIESGELNSHDTATVASAIIASCEGMHLIWLMAEPRPSLNTQIWAMVETTLNTVAASNRKP